MLGVSAFMASKWTAPVNLTTWRSCKETRVHAKAGQTLPISLNRELLKQIFMKNILLFLLTISVTCFAKAETYGYLVAEQEVQLGAGDVLQVLAASDVGNQPVLHLTLPNNSVIQFARLALGMPSVTPSMLATPGGSNELAQFVGPLKVKSKADYLSYRITRASEVQYKQMNIVSLPGDAVGAGTHNIVVEASDDLQTWVPVHSSAIGGNKAFFRTRITTITP